MSRCERLGALLIEPFDESRNGIAVFTPHSLCSPDKAVAIGHSKEDTSSGDRDGWSTLCPAQPLQVRPLFLSQVAQRNLRTTTHY